MKRRKESTMKITINRQPIKELLLPLTVVDIVNVKVKNFDEYNKTLNIANHQIKISDRMIRRLKKNCKVKNREDYIFTKPQASKIYTAIRDNSKKAIEHSDTPLIAGITLAELLKNKKFLNLFEATVDNFL